MEKSIKCNVIVCGPAIGKTYLAILDSFVFNVARLGIIPYNKEDGKSPYMLR